MCVCRKEKPQIQWLLEFSSLLCDFVGTERKKDFCADRSSVIVYQMSTINARFYARAVQLANWGALTRIILSGVLLSKF